MIRLLIVMLMAISLTGCQTAYFSAMEKMGIAKRDILVDRVEDARDAQTEAQEQFKSALDELSTLINFDGGDVQQAYDALSEQYDASQDAADNVSNRIGKIESVAEALFEEWQEEIEQYQSAKFKRTSQSQLRQTQTAYNSLLRSMRRSESKMQPVLSSLKDNVLYLKHNLNARAISAISIEFKGLKKEIQLLMNEVNKSIEESNKFIAKMDIK
ncbi:MAG: DUF2959 domain-containing protein [Gammaproteobacteria bacterium]|nr:DUF2959 domain-containing protein [Gammaproteobacteria bacterium]